MTNPYGTDPRSQPQGLGNPGNQGPQFVAPGTPGSYGPSQYGTPQYGPPQYGPPQNPPSQPYGQGYQQTYAQGYQQPYGQGYPPSRPPQPPSKRSSSTAIVVVVLLALVAGIAFGVYELYQGTTSTPATQSTPSRPGKTAANGPSTTTRPSATSRSTAGSTDCISGDQITTTAFVATVPPNWSCDGDEGDISISSTRNDAIWVEHDVGSGDVAADCKAQIEDLGTVSTLPEENWGGKTALAYQAVDGRDIFGVRCVVLGSQTWYLLYFPLAATDDAAVRADVSKVLSTWVWR